MLSHFHVKYALCLINALALLSVLCFLMLTYLTRALSQHEAKYALCSKHLIIVITVLKFYYFIISFFSRVTFIMLFFLILRTKLLYFVSSLRIFFILFTLYHKRSSFFMFNLFYKSLNFHFQLILIVIDSLSFCRAITSLYSSLRNVIRD